MPILRTILLRTLLLGCLLAVTGTAGYAQQSETDSLRSLLLRVKEDTAKVSLLNELGWLLQYESPHEARKTLTSSLKLAQKIGFRKGEGDAYNFLGVLEDREGNPHQACELYYQALEIRRELGDKKGVAGVSKNLAKLERGLGNYDVGIGYYLEVLRLQEELRDTSKIVSTLDDIVNTYYEQGNYSPALKFALQYELLANQLKDVELLGEVHTLLGHIKMEQERYVGVYEHYKKAYDYYNQLGDSSLIANAINNMGNYLDQMGEEEYKKEKTHAAIDSCNNSLQYYDQALRIYQSLSNGKQVATIYNNIGLSHKNLGSYYKKLNQIERAQQEWETALAYLYQALDTLKNIDPQHGDIGDIYNGLGDVYRRQGQLKKAEEFAQKALSIALEMGDTKLEQKANKDLAIVYKEKGELRKAFDYYSVYDSIRSERFSIVRMMDEQSQITLFGDLGLRAEKNYKELELILQRNKLQQARTLQYSLGAGALALILLATLLYNRNRLKTRSNRQLAEKNEIIAREQERSESLLLNILPAATAQELKTRGKAQARRYESVTVLFTDFKGFTQIAEDLSPEELVQELDTCFQAFDAITERHRVEKIKTIGDAYMCAGGLPEPNQTHPADVVAAALEMLDFMEGYSRKRRDAGLPVFEIRVGIHTGPVVAGIVGTRKFAYDIWGDTVNTASRMESSGVPGKINISETTYHLVREQFICSPRGKVAAKNKGELDMYYVESAIPSDPRFEQTLDFLIDSFQKKLDPRYTYHSLLHTLDVLQVATEIGIQEGLSRELLTLVRTAAALHDSGFLGGPERHEERSCQIAREHLPRFGYSDREIDHICAMILATQIPQSPQDLCGQVLCDADLDYLGRQDFYETGNLLRLEWEAQGRKLNLAQWNKIQIDFLEKHRFFTTANRKRREKAKMQRIQELKMVDNQ